VSIDLAELQKKLEQLEAGNGLADPNALIQELLDTSLPGFETELREMQKDVQATPTVLLAAQAQAPATVQAIIAGMQKYTTIPVPILAIYADPHDWSTAFAPFARQIAPAALAAYGAREDADVETQVKAFESGVPSAWVVLLPHADHYVFRSNEADVLREMHAFLTSLR
jgi:non-heme chloroperoxidase